ncbi:MAG: hypothetical protein J5705_03965 [Bacteroidaceae bacterium]|nr:hypothetical protein [Bacteroidaceae bacterium]
MKESVIRKSLSRAFCLIALICFSTTAGAKNTAGNGHSQYADTINSSIRLDKFSLDNLKIGQILESVQDFLNNIADNYPEGLDPVDLNLKLDFNFDLKSSQPFLLVQVIYNTLAGEDGMLNQLKDKKIEKFDEKSLKKLKRQFTKRSNKEIRKLCEGDRQTQKELKRKIKKLLDGIQIKE